MKLLTYTPHLTLYLHEGINRAIEAQWLGFASSAELRQSTLEAVTLARQYKVSGWIADDRLLGPIRPIDLEWIAQQVLPQLIGAGVKRFARIEAIDPMNKMLIGQAQKTAEHQLSFEMGTFTDLQSARVWACG
ncbi:hypothetical protein H8B13_12095 [Hymenobacter sp. BT188]|uniref:hypothetical protein n=1 Tax=Hymenobacter sp. BT188 TaxID=2763504 RepID=UPI0016516E2C|nr:hypothetical protein [Hymenobacter sp. BT188]MBC6607561.1 hypothetical protein [Hymenobacter sp. BT188]